jgi:Protein of unknown function (DUF3987)/Domain of unknown function (DUF3854)
MTSTGASLSRLLQKHLADLQHSGLSERTIAAWGAYSIEEDQKSVLVQLGFGGLEPPALALPILPPDRLIPNLNDVIVKPDRPRLDGRGHEAKYEVRPRSRNRIHVPLSIRDKLSDVSVPVVITEGQKKGEKAGQEGICTIALAGVWNWRDRIGEASFPISDFELIPFASRRVVLCFDSDAATNPQVCRAENDLSIFLTKRFGAHVSVKRLPPNIDDSKIGLDDFLIVNSVEQFWRVPEESRDSEARVTISSQLDWSDPEPLGDELLAVPLFDLALLPASFRPLVDDISDRMQTPADYAATAAIISLAGCVGRRAFISPKVEDTWEVVPNLWGAIVAPPGMMKSPVLRAVTLPLHHIEETWRAQFDIDISDFDVEKERVELRYQAWREMCKSSMKKGETEPVQPDRSLQPPQRKRLMLTDSTVEKLHEILAMNPAGVVVVRDELTGWLAQMDKPGRETERAFYLQAWNGDGSYTFDRIGRGSIYVPAVCVSLLGNIQPSRLRWYLAQTVDGGPADDGLFQRFQVLVWPDQPDWQLIDRPPNNAALTLAESVYSKLANMPTDDPARLRFCPDAQALFFAWLIELERKIRRIDLAPSTVSHLAKYRSLMPSLAGLFSLADSAAGLNPGSEQTIQLEHAQQAAALCEYLEAHARRAYACIASPELWATRELGRHIQTADVPGTFTARDVYRKGWSGLIDPVRVREALAQLQSASWVRPVETSTGKGRPSDTWQVNPKVVRRA